MRFPRKRLRYLATFNPPAPPGVRSDTTLERRLLRMEDINEFTGPAEGVFRPTDGLLAGYSFLAKGDVAYAKVTPCFENGKGVPAGFIDGPTFATTELTVLRPASSADARYLGWVLQSDVFREPAIAAMTGAGGLRRVPESVARDIAVPAPDVGVQRQIADYLDHETAEIDAFIADLSQLLQLEIDRVRSDQELAITTAAPVIAIRRLSPVRVSGVSVNASQDPAIEGQVGVLKTSAVSRGYFRPEENKAVVDDDEIARLAAPVMSGRVLVNRANTPSMVGSAAYVENACANLYLSDKIWSLDFDADNEYVWRALQTRYYREQVELSAVGASTSMQNLGYEDFLSARLPIPCITEQRRIAIRLRSTWDTLQPSLADIDAAIALAKERRAALITAAVTGQVDVTAKQLPAVDSIQTAIEEAR